MTLALHILETGGEGHAQVLIEAASRRAPVVVAAAAETPDREAATRDLAERLDLNTLKDIALEVVERKAAGNVRDAWHAYVEGTADDTASPEAVRRIGLARFIVDKAGPAFAAGKLKAATPQEPPNP